MSTSLLYHGFGIRGHRCVNTKYKGGDILFTIRQDPLELCCPICGSRDIIRRGQVKRRFRSLPVGKKRVWISLYIQRVFCLICRALRQVKIGFADKRRTYTKSFERYALDLSRRMTVRDAANHLQVSWDIIKDIQKRNLQKRYRRPKLRKLKQIAIDGISAGKGHRCLTIVLGLKTGRVVFAAEGKGTEALEPFWKRLKRSKAGIKAAAMDMPPAYITAVIQNVKEAAIVSGHFHVIKPCNEKLSDFRRKPYREAATALEKRALKGTRRLLLKNPGHLDETRNEPQRLKEATELNQPPATACCMKEGLRQLWSQKDKASAKTFLHDWITRAKSPKISMLMKFAQTLIAHQSGILSYCGYPISTAPLEGTNNKIKTMKRQAYGFRDMEFFKLKIMAIHETKHALVG